MTPVPSRPLATRGQWRFRESRGRWRAGSWTGIAGWGDAVGTVGCERLRLPLPLEGFSWGWEVTQLPPEFSALPRRHLGSLKTDLIWMLLILFGCCEKRKR